MPVTPEQYVDTIIETFTGRKMNPAFRNHLVEGLKSGQLTASMVDLAVINSKEGKEFAEKKKAEEEKAKAYQAKLREYIIKLYDVKLGNKNPNPQDVEKFVNDVTLKIKTLDEVEDEFIAMQISAL